MNFLGADTDQLRHLAQSYSEGSERCRTLLEELGRQADAVEWVGPDADSFRSAFHQVHAQLREAAQQIARHGTALEEDAEQQDDTSRPSAAGDGAGVGDLLTGAEAWGEMKTLSSPSPGDLLPDDPHEVLGMGEDVVRAMGLEKISEGLGEGTRAAKLLKLLPVIGAVPDAIELSRSLGAGDTTGAISNSVEMMLGLAPGPLASGASAMNSFLGGHIPGAGDRTVTDLYAEAAAQSPTTRAGEAQGHFLSDLIGLDHDSTARNALSSAMGAANHLARLNPMTAPAEIGNLAVGALKALPGL